MTVESLLPFIGREELVSLPYFIVNYHEFTALAYKTKAQKRRRNETLQKEIYLLDMKVLRIKEGLDNTHK